MYEDSPDIFAEMDELFDHLLSRLSGDFGIVGMGFSSLRNTISNYSEELEEPALTEVADGSFREPVPEIFHDEEGTKIVVELPGVTEDNPNLALRMDKLIIEAVDGNRMYHTQAPIPSECVPSTMRHSLKNGVLEVMLGVWPDSG